VKKLRTVDAVPDVGYIVEYGLNSFRTEPARYRVTAWLKPKPHRFTGYDMALTGAMLEDLDIDQRIDIILGPSAGSGDKPRLVFCRREEATHLSLTGICGCIAPISECKVVGRVAWTEKLIEAGIQQANRFAAQGFDAY